MSTVTKKTDSSRHHEAQPSGIIIPDKMADFHAYHFPTG